MKTYYVYHIEGFKIGVSTNPEKRVIEQGYSSFEILEEHTDIDVVSIREQELQKQYGYEVDKSLYSQSVANRHKWRGNLDRTYVLTKEDRSKGGRKNVESGHLARVRDQKKATEGSKKRIICPHCNKDSNTGNYARWHGDNCKHIKKA